uniref:GBD/FH3 domain-containing protein n=1 Tax=Rhabditophanes sp. KR3021 TaxID=114890 RepID=A0AC35U043_9BILA
MIEELMEKAISCFSKSTCYPPEGETNKTLNDPSSGKPHLPRLLHSFQLSFGGRQEGGSKVRPSDEILIPSTMPDAGDLTVAFESLIQELDLTPGQADTLRHQCDEKKWMMIVEQTIRKGNANNSECCQSYLHLLTTFQIHYPEGQDASIASQQLEELAICLRTESVSFVETFLKLEGLAKLVKILKNSIDKPSRSGIAMPVLLCFRALFNSSMGRDAVLSSPSHLLYVAGAISLPNGRCKALALSLLSGICLISEEGHGLVLKALTNVSSLMGERSRFQKVMDQLNQTQQQERDTERVRIAVMSLVNALLKSGVAERSLQFRLTLRYEMLMMGLQDVIDKLKTSTSSTLNDHFELFEMMREEDELEFGASLNLAENVTMDHENPIAMVEVIVSRLDNTVALPQFIAILQHFLMVPGDAKYIPLWKLFNLIIQQLSLQASVPDLEPQDFSTTGLKVNMEELLTRLRTQVDYDELEVKTKRLEQQLEDEKRRCIELENRLYDFQDGSSLDCFSRISDTSSNPSDPCHSPTPTIISMNTLPKNNPSIPLPPPLPGLGKPLRHVMLKKVPKNEGPLKSVNWNVIPQDKIKDTIWERLEDEKMYKLIDLPALSSTFSALKSDENDTNNNGMNTITRRLKSNNLISVIDSRRAHLCTIMMSKLRLTNKQIKVALMNMDENGLIPKDMIEQMLKYVPTKDEVGLLNEVVQKYKSPAVLASADRFIYEISTIPRYEERIKCIHTIRTFNERIEELAPCISAISKASISLSSSKRLQTLLSIMLAIGNYMNQGKHNGNAFGFHTRSLSAMADVKNSSKQDRQLLHFIVSLVESKFPEVINLNKELGSVYEASRMNDNEIQIELKSLESALNFLGAELKCQKVLGEETKENCLPNIVEEETGKSENASGRRNKSEKDRFICIVSTFLNQARQQFKEIESAKNKKNANYARCLEYFGEDSKMISSETFFGNFSKFLHLFEDCRTTLLLEKEEYERTQKATSFKNVFPKKVAKQPRNHFKRNAEKDFEKLINAIQTGEIFVDELKRLRSSFRGSRRILPTS